MDNKTRNTIKKLWTDPGFSGSFTGYTTFANALHHEKGLEVSKKELIKILHTVRTKKSILSLLVNIQFYINDFERGFILYISKGKVTRSKPKKNIYFKVRKGQKQLCNPNICILHPFRFLSMLLRC